ncbi:MAG: hypothetical protein HY673_18125 [Chloroflexi bacterium]|nr:hypothetical protein [Chloroflexota bacterium]
MIRHIDRTKCDSCALRLRDTCPVGDSCFQDVIRLDSERRPHIAYAADCCACHRGYYYACQEDCPLGAVEVSSKEAMPPSIMESMGRTLTAHHEA